MTHSHSHGQPDLRLGRWPKRVVIGLIVLFGVIAVAGMLRFMPDDARVESLRGLIPFAVEGIEVVDGQLITVQPACNGEDAADGCGESDVRVLGGDDAGLETTVSLGPDSLALGLQPGDRVLLLDQTDLQGSPGSGFVFYRPDRGFPMLAFAIIFAVVVVAVARLRGLMALVSLGFAGLIVAAYLIPALLSGQPAVPATLAASTLILVVMLYATHGVSMRTSVALLGALIGVALSTGFAWFAIIGSRLGGRGDEAAGLLAFNVEWIDVQQLVVASVILAGLGTLNDVTITQVSALWELRGASPDMSRWELFRRAMRIGRDHVASTVYTLVFAYLGTALIVLIAAQLLGGTVVDFLASEDVAEEIVRALVGGIALVLAMPITTAIGAVVISGAVQEPGVERTPRPTIAQRRAAAQAPAPSDPHRRMPDDPWAAD